MRGCEMTPNKMMRNEITGGRVKGIAMRRDKGGEVR